MENKITKKLVQKFFDSLPKKEILDYAWNTQRLIQEGGQIIILKKGDGTPVIEADMRIERMIIDCFNKSPLKDLCGIRGEEKVGDVGRIGEWTLLIDPVDGSSPLIEGSQTWGIMVGLVNKSEILKYSWNLLSTGEIFTTGAPKSLRKKVNLKRIKNPVIDFYDYSSGQDKFFRLALRKAGIKNFKLTSYPAAIWAGWELYQNKLSALVWIAGENEKKTYPDYDLIFLAALMEQGYKVRLGKLDSKENAVVVVAPTDEDADMLYKLSLSIVRKKGGSLITEIKNKLII